MTHTHSGWQFSQYYRTPQTTGLWWFLDAKASISSTYPGTSLSIETHFFQISVLSVSLSLHKVLRWHCGGLHGGWHGGWHGGGHVGRHQEEHNFERNFFDLNLSRVAHVLSFASLFFVFDSHFFPLILELNMISTILWVFLPKIEPHQQVRSAPSQSFQPLANPALSLENWTANTTINMTLAAAAVVLGDSHVSLTTQPLMLDSGRFHQHHLALQTAVVARVSGVDNVFFLNLHILEFCS